MQRKGSLSPLIAEPALRDTIELRNDRIRSDEALDKGVCV